MEQEQSQVTIQLSTVIMDDGEKESISNTYEGRFLSRGSVDVLMYEERTEENEVIKNLMTIHPEKVNIKRSGAITMNQQFLLDRLTESFFEHPHGRIHMETATTSLKYRSLTKEAIGKLVVLYKVKLNGQEQRNHQLVLTYKREEKE